MSLIWGGPRSLHPCLLERSSNPYPRLTMQLPTHAAAKEEEAERLAAAAEWLVAPAQEAAVAAQ